MANVYVDDVVIKLYPADLEHIDQAISLLKKAHSYTASDRLGKIRDLVAAYLNEPHDAA